MGYREILSEEKSKLDRDFTYHPPKSDQQKEMYESIRYVAKQLAIFISQTQPPSRELSLAITKIEEAIFWANAGIARNT